MASLAETVLATWRFGLLGTLKDFGASLLALLVTGLLQAGSVAADTPGHVDMTGNIERGEYLAAAAGCVSCHTDSENDGTPFAGGHRLETPYGVFVTPNITPDKETGIGNWTAADFVRAVRSGRAPDGSAYYPSFPYPSYAGMTEQDALDIKAWLDSLPAVNRNNEPNELVWYVPGRWAMRIWQALFSPWQYAADTTASPEWQRGAYLVRHLGHCGECHTPRNAFGALEVSRELAGGAADADDDSAPNITSERDHGIGKWTATDLDFFLEMGMLPDGDFVGGSMTAVVDDNTANLTAEDRKAIVTFLRSLPAQ